MMKKSFPIPPNTHLPWRQYGLCDRSEASPGFDPDLFRTLLSYVIPFSSPVIIRFKNGSISFRFSSGSHMETRSIKIFTVNLCETQVSSFFWYPVLCKWSKLFYGRCLVPWKCREMKYVGLPRFFKKISSTFSTIGRPGRGSSLIFPEQKRANQFWHWRSLKHSLP